MTESKFMHSLTRNSSGSRRGGRHGFEEDGKLDRIETLTRLDEDPKAPRGRGTPARKDFYTPLQTQIQLGSTGKKK